MSNAVSNPRGVWRKDGDGWNRYRGQGRRGAPSAAVTDAQDLEYAAQALGKAAAALGYAHGLDPKEWTAAQLRQAKQAALAQVAHAGRFLEELLDRHGYDW